MFERFTEPARQVVVLAQDEARALKHNYIGTEHILLGLLREEEGLAARVLESLGVTCDEVRGQVARIVGKGDDMPPGPMPFTPRSKRILELAVREAASAGEDEVWTEHLLFGLLREAEGVGAQLLFDYGVDLDVARKEIARFGSVAKGEKPSPSTMGVLARVRAARRAAVGAELRDVAQRLAAIESELTGGEPD